MNRSFVALLLVAPLAVLLAAAPPATSLDIYTIDVEGGKSVLIVSPSGESMLIDVGWPSSANRDASAEVVFDAVKRAGLKRIDYLVLSHFDVDHYSELGTADTNPPSDFIANLQGATDDHQLIKLSVLPDGTYTVTNTRNGFSRTYHATRAR